jgi:PP-loop superfamily ATP-utilizing enzyme
MGNRSVAIVYSGGQDPSEVAMVERRPSSLAGDHDAVESVITTPGIGDQDAVERVITMPWNE